MVGETGWESYRSNGPRRPSYSCIPRKTSPFSPALATALATALARGYLFLSLENYLAPRGKKGIWQLRMPIPRPLQSAYGRRERVKSLGTTDKQAATKLAFPILADWQKHLDDWQRDRLLDTPARKLAATDLAQLPAALFDGILTKLEGSRRATADDADAYDAQLSDRERQLQRMIRQYHGGDLAQWEAVAKRALETRGIALDADDPGRLALVKGLAEAGIEAWRVSVRQTQGELLAEPVSASVVASIASTKDLAPAGQTILDLFDKYAAERLAAKRKRPDTIKQDRKVVEQFADFVGRSRSVRSITTTDVREWIDTAASLPPSYRLRKDCQGLSMRQVAAKFSGANKIKSVSLTTLNKYLSTVSPLFTWMKKKDYRDGSNPCDGLFNEVDKGDNRRPSLTSEQINKIFGSPLFRGFLRDGQENVSGNVHADDWRYWIPLICLFTGTRIGEAAQLRIDDVQCKAGVWFMQICHDETTGQATKSRKSRPVALHSTFQSLGFLAFVDRQRARFERDGNAQLFPELEPNDRDQISGVPSRFWRRYLGKIEVKDGGDGFGAHSFRHTLADRLREEGKLLDNEVAVALGHSLKSTTGNYGAIAQGTVEVLHDMIERVRFDGIDFSHLIPPPAPAAVT